jgi:hypothetical protein
MVHAQAFHFVQWDQHPRQEQLMLFLQWKCKAINDRSQDLQEFCNAVEPLSFINKLEEYIVD